jgi:hypothetical protein
MILRSQHSRNVTEELYKTCCGLHREYPNMFPNCAYLATQVGSVTLSALICPSPWLVIYPDWALPSIVGALKSAACDCDVVFHFPIRLMKWIRLTSLRANTGPPQRV